jgi:DegV family protein with EDD domain
MSVAVVVDSSAYIPAEALEGLPVYTIPVWLLWEGDRLRDGVDIDPPTFYRRLAASKTLPTSSQPSAGEFVDFFRQVAATAEAIVCVLVSSELSGTVASARAAQAQLPELDIRIVDSRASTMAQGLMVLAAARAAAAGASADEVVAAARALMGKVYLLFVVDTLDYLHRGGRISGAKWVLATALRIKPILHFEDGRIKSLTQARTKRKALERIFDLARERLGGRAMAEAVIVDINSPEIGDGVAEQVKDRFAPARVSRAEVSPVVGMHVGPGAIGLVFYAEQ